MARALNRPEYEKVGQAKLLDFLDEQPPFSVYERCNWRCQLCGKTYHKTYRAVYLGEFGCRCQNSLSLPVSRYEALARELGFIFVGPKPVNVRVPTEWLTANGSKIQASYIYLKTQKEKTV